MKYLAVLILSLAASFTARTAPAVGVEATASTTAPSDRAVAGGLAAALVALQLRRRQKSLRMPRPLN
jgi:hypothetical protein